MKKTMQYALILLVGMAAATPTAAQERSEIVNEPVAAMPKSEVYGFHGLPWGGAAQGAAEPHIAQGTGPGHHQVIFPVRREEAPDNAPHQRLQHAIALDYTPASARVRAYLEGRIFPSIRDPSGGYEKVWGPADVHGFGVNGRLYWCYSFANLMMYRYSDDDVRRDWRLLFAPRDLESDQEFSYSFSAIPTDSVTCELSPEHDGGIAGTNPGTDRDFGPFDIYVDGTQGSLVQIEIGIRDAQCEDGDIVSVYIGDGYGDRAVFSNEEIFNAWNNKSVTVRAGHYYQVRAVAVNGTGYKGNCSHRDGNSGEMRVRSNHTSEIDTWVAPGGSERAGIINVIAR